MLPTQPRSQGPLLLTPGVREDPGNEVGSPLSLKKQWAQERTGPREGDTRGEMEQRRF